MSQLSDRQRAFVRSWIALGANGTPDNTAAAAAAGYASENNEALRVTAHRLAHNPKVQAAILETCRKEAVLAGAAVALPVTIGIALNEKLAAKDRLRACEMIFNRGGMPAMSEQKITVEHKADASQLKAFAAQLAQELGVSREKLLGWEGMEAKVVDAVEVTDADTPDA